MKKIIISLSILAAGFLVYWFFVRKRSDEQGNTESNLSASQTPLFNLDTIFKTSPVNPGANQPEFRTTTTNGATPLQLSEAEKLAKTNSFRNNLTPPAPRKMKSNLNTGGAKIYGGLKKSVNIV